jgi:hypothetical protein
VKSAPRTAARQSTGPDIVTGLRKLGALTERGTLDVAESTAADAKMLG